MAGGLDSDLVVLAADQDIRFAVEGLLSRPDSLGMSAVRHRIFLHPNRDNGCYSKAHEFLRPQVRNFRHALVIFDRMGCGMEGSPAEAIEQDVEQRLGANGWDQRAAAIVLDPELETWVWSGSPHVERELGWAPNPPQSLRDWLRDGGHWPEGAAKPPQPKEATLTVLRKTHKPWSPALYSALARRVGLSTCADQRFAKFKTTMASWFPPK